MPPVRETDVFSENPGSLTAGFAPGLMGDVFAGGSRIGAAKIPASGLEDAPEEPPSPRPRRATRAEPPADAWTPPPPEDPGESNADLPPEPAPSRRGPGASGTHSKLPPAMPAPSSPARKKRRWFGLKGFLLFILMPLCMAGAAAAIFSLLPATSSVVAKMTFEKFSAHTELERRAMAGKQMQLLASDAIRMTAADKLVAGSLSPGFLKQPIDYNRMASGAKFDLDNGVMTIAYTGSNIGPKQLPMIFPAASPDDRKRMAAVMQAMYDANRQSVQEAKSAADSVASLTSAKEQTGSDLAALEKKIDALAVVADSPDLKQRASLDAESKRLEGAYNAAVANAAKIAADLKVLRDNPNAPLPTAAGAAPAPVLPPPPPAPDDQLVQLKAQLQQINDQIAAAKSGQSEKSTAARAQLAAALDSFDQQITQARAAQKDSPAPLAFLDDGQKLSQATRDSTDQLIKRQQDQYAELSDLKARLNEKVLARRAEVWKKDPELLKLMDEKDIRTRQYNAAIGQGLNKEAQDIKADLNYLDSSIKARQTMVTDDGFYADAIDQLQKAVDAAVKKLDADRQQTVAAFDDAQSTFLHNQPATLTPDQQKLVSAMGKQLAGVSDARKQYALAADTAARQADEEVRRLQIVASQTQTKLEQRREQVAAADNARPAVPPAPAAPTPQEFARAVDQKTAELVAAEKSRDDVQAAFFAANKKVADLKTRADEARAANQERDTLLDKPRPLQPAVDQPDKPVGGQEKAGAGRGIPHRPNRCRHHVYRPARSATAIRPHRNRRDLRPHRMLPRVDEHRLLGRASRPGRRGRGIPSRSLRNR